MRTCWVSVRVDQKLKDLLTQVAAARRIAISDLVRESLLRELAKLSYLSAEEKKALGLGD